MTNRPLAHHLYELTILEGHLDTFGHVNNAAYLSILEEARWDMISSKGFGIPDILKTRIGPTILEIQIRFKKEIKLREKVSIESHTVSYEKKIAKLVQLIKNRDGEICTEAELTIALFDTKARKLILPTPEWLNAIGWKEKND